VPESPVEAERRYLQELAAAHPEKGLDLVDFLLHVMREYRLPQLQSLAAGIEEILADGGSASRVAADRAGLERRVPEEVAFRAREEMSADTKAAAHVRAAWTDVYGRHPNPSQGYREAVKAVEAAAIPVICPNDPTATLGKIIGQLRVQRDLWATSLSPQGRDGIDLAIGMLEVLWKSQLDRHGTPDANVPISVSLEEAEAALHLALTLVH